MTRFCTLALLLLAAPAWADCENLSGLQRAAGYVTALNVFRIFAIVGAVACVGALLGTWFRWLLQILWIVPLAVYEALGYAMAVGLIVSGNFLNTNDQLWPVLGGCLLFAAMLMISGEIHRLKPNLTRFFTVLFLLWSAVALAYQDQTIGFIAVGALMGAVGFSAAVIPMGYAVGFEDEAAVPRGTLAALIVLALGLIGHVNQIHTPFDAGAIWMGSFVFYLGLLIMASRYYSASVPYSLRQIGPVLFGFLAVEFGNTLGLHAVAGIGGTFLVLYLIEKATDIPARSVTQYATIGLIVSVLLGLGVWWSQHHMNLIQPYLLF